MIHRRTLRICNSPDFWTLGSGLYVLAKRFDRVWRSIFARRGLFEA